MPQSPNQEEKRVSDHFHDHREHVMQSEALQREYKRQEDHHPAHEKRHANQASNYQNLGRDYGQHQIQPRNQNH